MSFQQLWFNYGGSTTGSRAYGAHQHVDVSDIQLLDLVATATSGSKIHDGSTLICENGVIRIGITTTNPDVGWEVENASGVIYTVNMSHSNPYHANLPSPNYDASKLDLGYLEWNDGTGTEKEFKSIEDVYEELMSCYQELEEKNVENKADAIYSEHFFFCNTADLLDEDIQLTIKEYNYCKTFNTPPFQSLDKTPANIVDDFLKIEYIMKNKSKN